MLNMSLARLALCFLFLVGGGFGCRSRSSRPARAVGPAPIASIPPSSVATPLFDESAARALRRCFADQPAWSDAPVSELLDRAGDLFDREDFAGALACAEEAARAAPRSVEAHHDRAAALLHLGRLDEARDTLALALALDPEDAETLEASADLYINQLPPSADRSAIGLEQARRGFRRVSGHDRARAARLALLEGQALIDLGRSEEAVRRLDTTLALAPKLAAARYEKGVAEFELCRFADARRTFQKVLEATSDHAHALYHLGLIEEREGDALAAEKDFAEASSRDPGSFPLPPEISAGDFAARVRRVVAELPADVRSDIAHSRLETTDLPAIEDLVAEKPPLSPTILGLFRGLPLNWTGDAERRPQAGQVGRTARGKPRRPTGPGLLPATGSDDDVANPGVSCGSPERTIVLYRRNLLRSVHDLAELDEGIRRTLLHEVGHLRGEDDGSLRDRGLE
jgi:tetratricopeptide (TPR) repeat protein